MGMSGPELAGELEPDIKSAIEEFFGVPADDAKLTNFCTALSNAIGNRVVEYIQAKAVVPAGGLTSPAGAVSGETTVE